jgi:hypothetical protein
MRLAGLVLLGAEAVILRQLAHQRLTPLTLLCWAIALYSLGWTLLTVCQVATRPRRTRTLTRKGR